MRGRWLAAVAALMVLVGCQPAPKPGPVSSVSAPSTAVSSVVSTPTPSPTVTASATSSAEALFEEAKSVFLKYNKAELAVYAAGGSATLPDTVAPYVMGDYATAVTAQYAAAKSNGLQTRSTEKFAVKWIRQGPNTSGSRVALEACVDKSQLEGRYGSGPWQRGAIYQGTWYLSTDTDGALKIFGFEPKPGKGCS